MSKPDSSFRPSRRYMLRLAAGGLAFSAPRALAVPEPPPESYSSNEVIDSGHHFFGSISRGLGEGVETLTSRWGRPNAYILGQEAGGAFVGGLRYGEGILYTRDAGSHRAVL